MIGQDKVIEKEIVKCAKCSHGYFSGSRHWCKGLVPMSQNYSTVTHSDRSRKFWTPGKSIKIASPTKPAKLKVTAKTKKRKAKTKTVVKVKRPKKVSVYRKPIRTDKRREQERGYYRVNREKKIEAVKAYQARMKIENILMVKYDISKEEASMYLKNIIDNQKIKINKNTSSIRSIVNML